MLYDYRGLDALQQRVAERYDKGEGLDKAGTGQVQLIHQLHQTIGTAMANAQFPLVASQLDALKAQCKELEQVKVMVLFYHFPRLYRHVYSRLSADKMQVILKAAPGAKAEDYGYQAEPDGKFYVVDRFFEDEQEINAQDACGHMSQERIKNLTTIVQYLEKQKFVPKDTN